METKDQLVKDLLRLELKKEAEIEDNGLDWFLPIFIISISVFGLIVFFFDNKGGIKSTFDEKNGWVREQILSGFDYMTRDALSGHIFSTFAKLSILWVIIGIMIVLFYFLMRYIDETQLEGNKRKGILCSLNKKKEFYKSLKIQTVDQGSEEVNIKTFSFVSYSKDKIVLLKDSMGEISAINFSDLVREYSINGSKLDYLRSQLQSKSYDTVELEVDKMLEELND